MADFLTNLALRIVEPAQVRPRLAALFEPTGPEVSAEAEGFAPPAEAPVEQTTEHWSEGEAEHAQISSRPRIATRRASVEAEPPVDRPHPIEAMHDAARPAVPSTPVVGVPQVTRAEPLPQEPGFVPVHRADEGEPALDRAPAAALEHAPLAGPAQPGAAEPDAPRPLVGQLSARAFEQQDATPIMPMLPRAAPPEWPQPRASTRVESEPVIHVTIGRIEVRAVAPPRGAEKERASPVMSLEDYLRTRAR